MSVYVPAPQPFHSLVLPSQKLMVYEAVAVVVLFILLVWHGLAGKSSNGGQLVEWLIVHMLHALAYFMMLNTVNLTRFVTLTFWHCVTP